jgi:hypothetical protein
VSTRSAIEYGLIAAAIAIVVLAVVNGLSTKKARGAELNFPTISQTLVR